MAAAKKPPPHRRRSWSMLTVHNNRAGDNLPAARKPVLDHAKHALRRLFERE
jgi:hypothetical protein